MRALLPAVALALCACTTTLAGRFALRTLCEAGNAIGHPDCRNSQPCGNSCISWEDTCHIENPCESIQITQPSQQAAADAVPGLYKDQAFEDCKKSFHGSEDAVADQCYEKVYGGD